MNNFINLKIRELLILNKKFDFVDDKFLFVYQNSNKILLGCIDCYCSVPVANETGYKIEAGNLIKFSEKYNDLKKTMPKELANNLWLCPTCGRPFMEILPNFDLRKFKNVSV
jgi:hypothetical protein